MEHGIYNLETLTQATFLDSCRRNLLMLVRGVNENADRLERIETNLGTEVVTTLAETVRDNDVENGERHLMMGFE